jgi:hypothetical protein
MTRRLAEVIVRSAGEAPHPVRLARSTGEDDHGKIRVETGRQAVRGAHSGLADLDRPQRLARHARSGHPKPLRGQVVEQERSGRLVVLHHQDQALLVHTRKRTARKNLAPAAERSAGVQRRSQGGGLEGES